MVLVMSAVAHPRCEWCHIFKPHMEYVNK